MLRLLLKRFKRIMIILLIGLILMGGGGVYANDNEYVDYNVGNEVKQEQSIENTQQDRVDVVIRVGEYDGKAGKRVYIDNINWANIPTDIPIKQDSKGHYIQEYHINKRIANVLYDKLQQRGVNVVLQDTKDRSEDLNASAEITNKINPRIRLSIHTNSFKDNSEGYFFMHNEGDEVATNIANRLSNSMSTNGMIPQMKNRANVDNYIGELSHTHDSTISILGELGFFSNTQIDGDLQYLLSDEYVESITDSLSNEIDSVLNDYFATR